MQIQNIVANLTIKRIPDHEIIEEIKGQMGKTVNRVTLFYIRQRIKGDSYQWYQKLREGEYEYIHEFRERIKEIMWLQKKHNEIIEKYSNNPQIQQTSLAELHKLNLTLSNYFDVAPDIIGNSSIPTSSQNQGKTGPTSEKQETIIV